MPAPYLPRHQLSKAAYGPESLSIALLRGLTGSPTGPSILFLILSAATALMAALVAGGLAASPFSLPG